MHMVRPLLQQAHGLPHVVRRADGRAGVTAGLLEEAEGVVWSHHVPADSPQTPGGKQKPSEIRKWKSFFFVGLFRVYFSKKVWMTR